MSLIKMSLSAALMIVAVIIARSVSVERLPKKTFIALWSIILIRLLVPFSIPSPASIYSVIPQQINEEINLAEFELSDLNQSVQEYAAETAEVENSGEYSQGEVYSTFEQADEDVKTAAFPISVSDLLHAAWMAGAVGFAVYFAAGYIRSYLVFRTAVPVSSPIFDQWRECCPLKRRLSIKQIDRISTPLTYGIIHPVILLPKSSLSQSDRTLFYVLTHEYVHIRRFDSAIKILLTLAVCVHWMNPFVWVMYLLMNRDIELACDEGVLKLLGRENRSAYAYALINMEESRSCLSPLYSGFNKTAIEERIGAIMKMKKASLISIIVAAAMVAGITTVFATSPKKPETSGDDMKNKIETTISTAAESSSSKPSVESIVNSKEYEQFQRYGLTVKDDELYYYGDLVKYFNAKTIYYYNEKGTVNVSATYNAATGALTGLDRKSEDEEMTLREKAEKYKEFGLTYDDASYSISYQGKRVRFFRDYHTKAKTLEVTKSTVHYDPEGVIDVYAVRDYNHLDQKGKGKLVGLEIVSDEEFAKNSAIFADVKKTPDGRTVTPIPGARQYKPYISYDECLEKAGGDEQKALTEYFESLCNSGLTFKPSSNGKGDLYYRDYRNEEHLVKTFTLYELGVPVFCFESSTPGATSTFSLTIQDGATYVSYSPNDIPYPGVMSSFTKDFPITFNRDKQAWTYKGETIRKFKNGQFILELSPDGVIDVETVFEDGIVTEMVSKPVAKDSKSADLDPVSYFKPPVENYSMAASRSNSSAVNYYAPEGSEVCAVVSGTVTASGWKNGYGNCVTILDENGISWNMAHLKSIQTSIGDTITAGDKVGTVGHTGWAEDFYVGVDAFKNEQSINLTKLLSC